MHAIDRYQKQCFLTLLCRINKSIKGITAIILLLVLSGAYPCSMFLKDNIHWGNKIKEYEEKAISDAVQNADAILIVRTLSYSIPDQSGKGGEDSAQDIDEIILIGPNPNAGRVQVRHVVKVLKVLKGSYKAGDKITINTIEPERFGGRECGNPDPEVVLNVYPMDNTFKYLVYLDGKNIVRQNMFIEWYEHITAEEELKKIREHSVGKP